MSTCCPKPLRTKVAEWDILDSCGRPLSGGGLTDAVVRTNAFTELTVGPDIEEGTNIRVTNAAGEICINDQDDAQIVGYNLGLRLCGVPYPVMQRLLGLRSLTAAASIVRVGATNSTTAVAMPNTTGINVGDTVVGGGIPAGATVATVTPGTGFTLSAAATTTVASNSLTFGSINTVGGAMPIGKISRDPQALHLWMQNKVKGDCGGGISWPFVEFLLPWTWRWRPDGDLAFNNGNLEFGLTGYAEDNPNFSRGYSTAAYATNWTAADAVVEALLWKCVGAVPAAVECDYIDGLVPS